MSVSNGPTKAFMGRGTSDAACVPLSWDAILSRRACREKHMRVTGAAAVLVVYILDSMKYPVVE